MSPRMATSRVMASSSSANSDLASQSSPCLSVVAGVPSFASMGDPRKSFGSMTMEDLLRNIYGDNSQPIADSPYVNGGEPDAGGGDTPAEFTKGVGVKTTEEVWREITAGQRGGVAGVSGDAGGGRSRLDSKETGEMTLEDFLAKAGAVMEEDVNDQSGIFAVNPGAADQFGQQQEPPRLTIENPVLGFRNGMESVSLEGGRGRRRAPLDPLDKTALQRQKRMIKNRESAARSRERKQAYTAELESLVHQLEEENAQLHTIVVEQNKQRLKELMEKVIPVTLKKNNPRRLQRTRSMEW